MTTRRETPSVQNYGTPWHIVRAIERDSFGAPFALDPCADAFNAKAERFYGEGSDGLTREWCDRTFVNPPYNEQKLWLGKAMLEARHGYRIALLLKLSADASYWRSIAYEHGTVDLYEGRIAFLAPRGGITLKRGGGTRFVAEGEPVRGSDFASALVLLGPGFASRVVRYRSAKTGELIPAGQARAA